MSLQSDLSLAADKFRPDAVSDKTKKLNGHLINIMKGSPPWWEVGAAKYRVMRANGETPLPGRIVVDSGITFAIPSREEGRDISCRVFKPESGSPKGIFYHIHGGGWVLQSEKDQDPLLKRIADGNQLTVVSVGYRLAPEHPFPAGNEDCYDAAEWLVDNGKNALGVDLLFAGGESAGGHLTAATCLHLIDTRPKFAFQAVALNYGAFDLSLSMPHMKHLRKPPILTDVITRRFIEAFTPGMSPEQRQDPALSPYYAKLPDLGRKQPSGKLPPAFFACGTEDILLDDTMMMSTKWMMSGAEAVVKLYPGGCHGFTLFPPEVSDESGRYRNDLREFLRGKMGTAASL